MRFSSSNDCVLRSRRAFKSPYVRSIRAGDRTTLGVRHIPTKRNSCSLNSARRRISWRIGTRRPNAGRLGQVRIRSVRRYRVLPRSLGNWSSASGLTKRGRQRQTTSARSFGVGAVQRLTARASSPKAPYTRAPRMGTRSVRDSLSAVCSSSRRASHSVRS